MESANLFHGFWKFYYFSVVFLVFLNFVCWSAATSNDGDIYPDQPKIVTEDGHLLFLTAGNRNITFRSKGSGKIRVNEEDLEAILVSAKQSVAQLELIKNDELVRMRENIRTIETQVHQLVQQSTRLNDMANAVQQLTASQTNSSRLRNMDTRMNTLTRRMNRQKTRLDNLMTLLQKDECVSNPCLNGATCHDNYNKVICTCPVNWEGPMCANDVNECARFVGTGLGCQNGATCQNTYGSYTCQCPPDWFGVHCTERHDDCSSASNEALCGHGTCVNQARTQSGQIKYTCICNEGWTTDGVRAACNVDVNECASDRRSPCSTNPSVRCINLPGTYTCGSCPNGYSGNGFVCDDINECLWNNGGCSMTPLVQCINTLGSRQCAPCPPGYQGNGETCVYLGLCRVNNGGCHPLATCVENSAISSTYAECRCPAGYQGSGIGSNGCVYTGSSSAGGGGGSTAVVSADPCSPNPCLRGTCVAVGGSSYRCNCQLGFSGQLCEIDVNECLSQPCQNGGTCVDQTNGYHCNCPDFYTGNRCEVIRDECGAYLNGDNGTLVYPIEQLVQYPHNRSCAWVITTPQTQKVINITFTRFNLELSHNCDFDFLQIHDGNSAGAHPLGRFCGSNPPRGGSFLSTHNQLYLWFQSDATIANEGFSIRWNTVDSVCGEQMNETKDHGTIKSPGYPGKYPLNRDCVWLIRVPPSKKIQLSFATLQLEHHDNCNYDFVEIRDGWRENDPVLATYCSTVNPAPIQTSSSYVRVYFHSDHSHNDVGFLITYNSIPGIPGCGGLLTGAQGSLSSPDHPNRYDHGLECDWLIRVHPNERVKLTFTAMELEFSANNCQWDFVEVFDGSDDTADSFGRRCGRNIPQPIISSGSNMLVKFRTDSSIALSGFRATYELVCGGLFTTSTGVIHSPYYPDPYPASRECVYVIRVDPGKAINLWFEAFDIEDSTTCYFDYLEIHDGDTSSSPQMGRYCGDGIPETIVSSYNVLWLKFKTDSSIHNRGFLANYTTIDLGCGGIYHNLSTGVITSPNHPEEYLHNVSCRWIIRPPAGYLIRLTFTSFSLESHWQCNFDYLAVYDNVTAEDPLRQMGKFCGAQTPPTLTSSDNLMFIVFRSDISVARDGFSITFNTIDASSTCGGDYFTAIGVIRSPNYPNNYRHGLRCTYTIKIEAGKQIKLNISRFQLERHSNCNYDYLELRNGGYMTSPLIGRFCGTTIPQIITSHSHLLWLQFVTDGSQSAPGFEIYWDATLTGCGGILRSSEGSLSSPNYPMPCQAGFTCRWRIQVNRGNKIRMVFTDLDTLSSRNCANGVKVYNGENNRGAVIGSYCGNHIPDPISSTANEVYVEYQCPYFIYNQRGFQISYTTDCNVALTGRRGVIETPNFPEPYPHNRNCTWTINAPLGNPINISFALIRLEPAPNCNYDFVQVTNEKNSSTIGRYCGTSDVPSIIPTDTNVIKVNFVSDHSLADNGFSLEWVTTGCGGDLRKPMGSFSTPNYPRKYPVNIICEWNIQVDIGHGIELTIPELDLEGAINCNYDSIKVFTGSNDEGILLAKICEHKTTPTIISSSSNRIFVKFQSDYSHSGRGFNATYITRREGCGGLQTTTDGAVHSRNYPSNYPIEEDCTWLIKVAAGHTISMQILDIAIPSAINCSDGYLAIYDGENQTSAELIRKCDVRPVNLTSSGNKVLIRHRGDSQKTGKGFSLTYTTTCGSNLTAGSEEGEINTFDAYPISIRYRNCSWIIRAQNPEDRVSFTVTAIERSGIAIGDCSFNYIEIIEGAENNNSAQLQKICDNHLPPTIISRGDMITVKMIYLWSGAMMKFRAIYHQTSAFCGGVLEGLTGSFASPEYPNYPLNIECIWTIKASPGNKLSLSFSSFSLEQSDYCNGDYVEIRENDAAGPLISRMCGQETDITNLSNLTAVNQLWIAFRSDSQGTDVGFVAQYSIIPHIQLRGLHGEVSNPLYPRRLSQSVTMSWTITVPLTFRVEITIEQVGMYMYYGGHCNLKVYDGPDETSTILGTFCVNDARNTILSSRNIVHITFHSRDGMGGSYFLLRWNATVQRGLIGHEVPQPLWITTNDVAGCGGVMYVNDSQHITVTSPGFPSGYANNLRCEWLITTVPTNHFVFRWKTLDIEDIFNCGADNVNIWISVLETSGERWVPIGTYCRRSDESQVPIPLWSNSVRIRLSTNVLGNRTGFEIVMYSACGGNVSSPSGVIKSPFYPSIYIPEAICDWSISVRPGRVIKIEMTGFELEGDSPSCRNDYLLLRNGLSSNSPVLGDGKFCGTTGPNQFLETTSNHLFVRFVSNAMYNYKGFELRFSEVSVECGQTIVLEASQTIVINTPNYPSIYPVQSQCEWRIIGPPRMRIKMDFQDHFDIPFQSRCESDFVSIHDGGTVHSPSLGQFCGHNRPSTLISTANTLFVRFQSQDSHPSIGFKASITTGECGGEIINDMGTISSPNYPNGYSADLNCEWIIRGPAGHFFLLNFIDLQTSSLDNSNNCSIGDSVQIRDISSTGPLLGEFCGQGSSVTVRTADNIVHIRFKSFTSSPLPGFLLRYNISAEECGGALSNPSGIIVSPNYPRPYPDHRRCQWTVWAPEGRKVRLQFTHFDLDDNNECIDRVQVISNPYKVGSNHYGYELCGTTLPSVIQTTSNYMSVIFTTDNTVSGTGFRAMYDTNLAWDCGGQVSIESGTISSPNYTSNGSYAHNVYCHWSINNPNAVNISYIINMHNLDLENPVSDFSCPYDAFGIYEGSDMSGTNIMSLCGTITTPTIYVVPFSQLFINFQSDASVAHSGFNLSYTVSNCGGVVRDMGDTIYSPSYPSNYPNGVLCSWAIRLAEGQQAEITFDDFQLESSTNCTNDYVLVRNGLSLTAPTIGPYCGSNRPSVISTQRHEAIIEFHTDNANSAKGFKIIITPKATGCSGIYHDEMGQLSSVNYPNNYPSNLECDWQLESVSGFFLTITFVQRFDIEYQPNCVNDFVEGFQYENFNWVSMGRRCGRDMPQPYITQSNKFRLLFRSNEAVNGHGFRVNWTRACGGIFNGSSEGSFSSPGYPAAYQNLLNCNYLIIPPLGHYVVITFDENYDIEDGPACAFDVLKVYGGNSTSGELLRTSCGRRVPAAVSWRGPLFLSFETDHTVTKTGFRVTYKVSECGGNLTGNSGEISSPTLPDSYHNNMRCSWVITVPSDKIIELKFVTMEIEVSYKCIMDYVAIYNRIIGNQDRAIGRYCGRSIPPIIRSNTSTVSIDFITNNYYTLKGFRLLYRATYGVAHGCGGMMNTSSGTIESLDTDRDGKYEYGLVCDWSIAVGFLQTVQVTFSRFDIEKPPNRDICPWDYIELRDGFSSYSRLIGRYCGTDAPPTITTSGPRLFVRFVSDESFNKAGFTLNYQTVEPRCGGFLNGTGIIQSPNYPEPYPLNIRCRWVVFNPDNSPILLKFSDINLEVSPGCQKDALFIANSLYSRTSNLEQIFADEKNLRFSNHCGFRKSYNRVLNFVWLLVDFVSDASVIDKGFRLELAQPSCNETHTTPSGYIFQRIVVKGEDRVDPQSCVQLINVTSGWKITLEITIYRLRRNRNCEDYIEVRDGGDEHAPLLGKWCTLVRPNPVFSSGNLLWVKAHLSNQRDYSIPMINYGAHYTSTDKGAGCGGSTNEDEGSIVSPNYPGSHAVNDECRWVIQVAHNRIVALYFQVLNFGPADNCTSNYIKVFSGTVVDDDNLITTICGGDNVRNVRSQTNAMVIEYVTSTANNGTGFRTRFNSVTNTDQDIGEPLVPQLDKNDNPLS